MVQAPGGENTPTIIAKPTATTTYTVDVTSGTTTCQSDVTISVQPLPTVDLGADIVLCNGATQRLDVGTHTSFLWSTGETTHTIDVNTAGTYHVTVQDATGCEASDTLVATEKILAVDAGTDQTICLGSSAILTANIGNNYTIGVATPSGSSDYTLSGAFSGNDPPINITLGDTLTFNVNASGHPFYLKTSNTTGTSDAITVANNGTSSGTITWSPTTAGTYYYICEYHAGMVGTITVANSTATYAWSTGETTQTINEC